MRSSFAAWPTEGLCIMFVKGHPVLLWLHLAKGCNVCEGIAPDRAGDIDICIVVGHASVVRQNTTVV